MCLATITFLALPVALAGCVLAVGLGDGILSLGSLVGFLTVLGIAARNGILMISHFQHLERDEGQQSRPAASAARRPRALSSRRP
jgi:Cu/Ag efflux pump CusA